MIRDPRAYRDFKTAIGDDGVLRDKTDARRDIAIKRYADKLPAHKNMP